MLAYESMVAASLLCLLGIKMMRSAWAKFRAPDRFAVILGEYSAFQAGFWRRVIPVIEFCGGAGLCLSPVSRWRLPAAIALAFIAAATLMIGRRWIQGETSFACGCGTDLDTVSRSSLAILRNLFWMVVLGWWLTETPAPFAVGWWMLYTAAVALHLSGETVRAGWVGYRRVVEWKVAG